MAAQHHDVASILSASDRDFVVTNDGTQVKVETLKGKKIGLYFSASWCGPCRRFTPQLVNVYNQLSSKGDFQIVFISSDFEAESFDSYFSKMPWLAVPFADSDTRNNLSSLFDVSGIPHLAILDDQGNLVTDEGTDMISEYGVDAYPFTAERISELKRQEEDAQTLESILVSGDLDYVIGKGGVKVPVSDLVGKTILLSFSAHWCPPCRAFQPTLVDVYTKIKTQNEAFEVIFIFSDRDQSSFDDYYSQMPWLALPFGDERRDSLSRKFKVRGIPTLVALGPTGRTITTEARDLIMAHGADAYPFTEEHLKQIEAKLEEMAKGWPEKVKHSLHEDHELVLTRRGSYGCDGCRKEGLVWSYYCEECDYDLHPECALTKEEGKKEGWICEDGVCRRE